MFAHHRAPVRGEREDAVEPLDHADFGKRGQKTHRLGPGRSEVGIGEGQHRGHRLGRGQFLERGHVHRHRAMPVVADAHRLAVLAIVEVGVLMPKNGQSRVGVASRLIAMIPKNRQRSGFGVLVPHRDQGYAQSDQVPEFGAPEPGTRDHDVGLERALGGADTGHRTSPLVDLDHVLATVEHCAPVDCPPHLHPDRGRGTGQAIGRCVQAAQNDVSIDQRMEPHALVDIDDRGFDSLDLRPARLPVQVGQSLGRGGNLEPADSVETEVVRRVQRPELGGRVVRELRHGPRRVGLEHQSWCVRTGPTCHRRLSRGEWTAVEDGHLCVSQRRQLVGQGRSDHTRTDDQKSRLHHPGTPNVCGETARALRITQRVRALRNKW